MKIDQMYNSDDGFIGDDSKVEKNEDVSGEVEMDGINEIIDAKTSYNNKATQIDSILSSLITKYYIIPPFQRRYVWDKEKVAYLAFSIIKNFPIPPMYVYIDKKTKKQVVLDGQQRMISVFLFYNDLTYIESNNSIDFEAVSKLNEKLRKVEVEIEGKKEAGKKNKDCRELIDEANELKKVLLEKHGMKRWYYTIENMEEPGEKMDISYAHFSKDDQEYLIHKSMDVTVVECNDQHPEVTYANIFKLLNSAGKNLGPQEIRNGIYWQTELYKRLYKLNSENKTWRTIYGNLSIYSKDMEILLKVLALSHYSREVEDRVEIISKSFSWAKIMDSYSLLGVNTDLSSEVDKLESFLNNIKNVNSSLKCRKAVFEAVFVAVGLIDPTYTKEIDYTWLCDEAGKDFGIIESSRQSVEARLTKALRLTKEKINA